MGQNKVKIETVKDIFWSIIDDLSRKMSIFHMREKYKVFRLFRNYVYRAEKFLNCKVKAIKSDDGTELMNNNFKLFCDRRGVKHEFTNIYTSEQNVVVEQFNQITPDGMRAVLQSSPVLHMYLE